jgi:Uma2 family endonuclease
VSTTPIRLLTFAEFERLPDPREGHYELHQGELVHMPPPKHGHKRIQQALQQALMERCGVGWTATMELGFQPQARFEYWVADVALTTRERWLNAPSNGYFQGSPELVIEVLSPSNTATEMDARCEMCLASGAREFWVVNPTPKSVTVWTQDRHSVRYGAGETIALFTGGTVGVDEIFA